MKFEKRVQCKVLQECLKEKMMDEGNDILTYFVVNYKARIPNKIKLQYKELIARSEFSDTRRNYSRL